MKGASMARRGSAWVSLCLALVAAANATGAESGWTGSTDAVWFTTTNWNPGIPGSSDLAAFDGPGNGNTSIDLGGGVTVGGLRFATASAAAYTIGSAGQSLTVSAPGAAVTVAADVTTAQTLAADVLLGAAGTFTSGNDGGGLLTFAGAITGDAAGTAVLAVAGTGDTAVTGAVTTTGGNVSLLKQGSGVLTLAGGGTFAGSGVVDPAGFAASVVLHEGSTVVSGGSYDASGTNLIVGSFVTAGAEGANVSLQVEAGGVISGIDGFNIGRGNGTGTVSSDVVLNGDASISAVSGTFGFNGGSELNQPRTSLVLNDSSTLSLSGKFITVGRSAGSNSTLTVNDSALVDMTYAVTSSEDGGGFAVGRSGGSGSLTVNGGTVRATWVDVARGDNNTQTSLGTVTVTNGGLLSSQGNVRLGFAGNGSTQAAVTVDGGTLSVGTTAERWMILGRYDATNSTVTVQNGGRIDLNANSDIRFTQNSNTGTNVFTLTDGTVTGYSDEGQTPTGNSVIDLNYGSTASGTNNTFNLDGGTLTIRRVVTSNNSGTATFNFNGGILRANGPIASLVDLGGANQRALVRNGGARVDTNGFDVTLPEALLHSDIDGDAAIDGGLTKLGAGTLTLSGLSSYTGDTSVEAGAVSVTTAVSLGTGGISIADGAALNLAVAGAVDTQFTTSSLTLGASSLAIDLVGFGNPSLAPLAVGGTVAVGGATTIDFATLTPAPGTIPLISYGSLSGFANLSLGTLPLGMTASLVNNTAASTIDLVVASLALPRWNGNLSGVWDVGGTANWIDSVTNQPATFTNGEPARFDDQATGTTTVSIPGTVLPGSVTVANESLPYTFSGAGGIGGSGGLTKSGVADLTISNVNSFTGAVRIEGGRLLVQTLGDGGVAGPLGASSAAASNLVLAGGTLVYGGGTATSDRGFRGLAGTSALEVSDPAATLTLTGSTAGGGGEIAKTGLGTLVLASATNTLPETRVVSGTLALAGPGATADSQTTRIEGSLWAGAAPDQAATLAVTNATLSIRDYLQVGRGTGTTGVTSTATFTNSAVTTGNLQMGYDNQILGNLSSQHRLQRWLDRGSLALRHVGHDLGQPDATRPLGAGERIFGDRG
jgi:fibronectin-binding autotransporter adhesin